MRAERALIPRRMDRRRLTADARFRTDWSTYADIVNVSR